MNKQQKNNAKNINNEIKEKKRVFKVYHIPLLACASNNKLFVTFYNFLNKSNVIENDFFSVNTSPYDMMLKGFSVINNNKNNTFLK